MSGSTPTPTRRSYSRIWTSAILGVIVLVAATVLGFMSEENILVASIVAGLFLGCLAADLCYEESCSRTIICAMSCFGFNLSGTLFVVDELSDLGWLIIFKLIVWLIGAIIGLLGAILSIVIAAIASPIGLIFSIRNYVVGED